MTIFGKDGRGWQIKAKPALKSRNQKKHKRSSAAAK
jgi:hypothetical protein